MQEGWGGAKVHFIHENSKTHINTHTNKQLPTKIIQMILSEAFYRLDSTASVYSKEKI